MRRREVIALLGAAVVSPWAARAAQQPKRPVVGFMSSRSAADSVQLLQSFHRGLREAGYVEGRNVAIEYRWANGDYARLPALASDLVNRRVAVIAAFGGGVSARAARAATSAIPTVISLGEDPVAAGLVKSLARPEGNITGVMLFTSVIGSKRLGLLRELAPHGGPIAVLVNLASMSGETQKRDVEKVAQEIGQRLLVRDASNDEALDRAFTDFAQQRAVALLVGADPYFDTRRDQIIQRVAQHRWPAIYQFRDYVAAGGLMSYGASIVATYFQNGLYVGRILGGAKPADMPVQLPTKFELVINMKTAKALGIAVPPGVLAIADEVIE